jgi:hypothetical protein
MPGPLTSTERQSGAAPVDDLEASVAAAIAACDGDLRASVRALLLANAFLEEELARARASLSRGYVRGKAGSTT